jgi:hypothetical protein
MNIIQGDKFNATYEVIMPQANNDTSVWGFARAFDDHGNLAESPNQRIYYAMTPDPRSTYLDLTFYVRHVDPKTMIINMTIFAVLHNAWSYSPEILNVEYRGFDIPINKPAGDKYTYSNEVTSVDVFYSKGHPELYPFDGYNYTFNVMVPFYLNESGTRSGGVPLKPNVVYVDFIGVQPGTLVEALDNSAWEFHSEIRYFPSANFTSRSPYIRFTVVLERRFEQINYLLLVPTLSLYALLGFSVLLRGREELRNRLLLYLNVFVFSYGFQSGARSLSIAPIALGFSMIERLVLALIPCTAILAVFSIIGAFSNRSTDERVDLSGMPGLLILDVIGILVSCLVLYGMTLVTVTEYLGRSPWVKDVTYSLFDMGWLGWLFFVLLFMGIVVWLALLTVSRFRGRFFLKHRTLD